MKRFFAAFFEPGLEYVHDGYGYPIDDEAIQYCMEMLLQTIELRGNPERLAHTIRANNEEQARLDALCKSRQTVEPPEQDSFIYVAIDKKNGLYKIGFTTNVESRQNGLKKLNSGIEFKTVYPGRMSDERLLHKHFKKCDKWAYGEWFKLDQKDLAYIDNYFTSKAA